VITKRRLVQVCVAALFITTVLWVVTEERVESSESAGQQPVLKVSTLELTPTVYGVKESVVGITQARWKVDLISAVEGRVLNLNNDSEPGNQVTPETLLVAIDDTSYKAQLANSDAQVKQAQLELARYQHEQTVTEQVSAGNKLTAFGRFEPHIEAAKANLKAATNARNQAQQRLLETNIYPSFNAVVFERWVVPGQWVNSGDRLFTLIASDSIDIYVELSPSQKQKLGALDKKTNIIVADQKGQEWDASLRYEIPAHSAQTKQSQLVLYIENPYMKDKSLLPNSMVSVTLIGQQIDHVVCAPSTVMTPDGYVWIVENERLNKAQIQIHEEFDGRVCFQFMQQPEVTRELVRFPISTMLVGQQVEPVVVDSQGITL